MQELDREFDGTETRLRIHVPFQIAHLAKSRGFNYLTEDVYEGDPDSELFAQVNPDWNDAHLSGEWDEYMEDEYFIPAPSQAVLQMWLKDVHGLDVWAQPFTHSTNNKVLTDGTYSYFIFKGKEHISDAIDFEDYYKALDEGLSTALYELPKVESE